MNVKFITPEVAENLTAVLQAVPSTDPNAAIETLSAVLQLVVDAVTDKTLYLATEDGETHITDDQGQDITVKLEDV